MRAPTLLLLAAPLLALAVPGRVTTALDIANIANGGVDKRQAPPRPPPCQRADPPPTEEETSARFDKFVDAFVVNKNISEAFTYIAEDYIVCHPFSYLTPLENSRFQALRVSVRTNDAPFRRITTRRQGTGLPRHGEFSALSGTPRASRSSVRSSRRI